MPDIVLADRQRREKIAELICCSVAAVSSRRSNHPAQKARRPTETRTGAYLVLTGSRINGRYATPPGVLNHRVLGLSPRWGSDEVSTPASTCGSSSFR